MKSVNDIIINEYSFTIPDYQRGYRWGKDQTEKLLEDIIYFARNKKERIDFFNSEIKKIDDSKRPELQDKLNRIEKEKYLLQPLVVNGKDKEYAVIDGQQRLTTISLILFAYNYIIYPQKKEPINNYSIIYDKNKSAVEKDDYLLNTQANTLIQNDSIDYFYRKKVYKCICDWIKKLTDNDCLLLYNTILNDVEFIWYNISDEKQKVSKTEEIEVFTRLNVGKIPLTDAELIKALFLNKTNFDKKEYDRQLKIAYEWNEIENTLQNDEFWMFIHNPNYSLPTRIDYLFELIFRKEIFSISNSCFTGEHKLFEYFYAVFDTMKNGGKNADKTVESIWDEVKKNFRIIKEWYSDYRLYHYIGYLVSVVDVLSKSNSSKIIDVDSLLLNLISHWDNSPSKERFVEIINNIIADVLREKKWINTWDSRVFEIPDPNEGDTVGKRECNDLLLLHNIETIIMQNDELALSKRYNQPASDRFPFHLYKIEKWETEHIHPNADDDIKNDNIKIVLLKESRKSLDKIDIIEDETLIKDIDDYLEKRSQDFTSLYRRIIKAQNSDFDKDPYNKNKIWNYTLLDKATNCEYGNYIFKIKRSYIMNKEKGLKMKLDPKRDGDLDVKDVEKEVAYVLPCTKNVFAKFYSVNPGSLDTWTTDNAKDYLDDMKNKIGKHIEMAKVRNHNNVKSLIRL